MPAARRFGDGSLGFAGALAALAGAEILLGLVYQWYFLTTLGPGTETDALYAGMIVPQLVLIVITGSLTQVLVPLLAVQDEGTFAQTVWTFVQGLGLVFGGVVVLGWLLAGVWVPLTVPRFAPAARELTVELVRIQLLGLLFGALSSALWAAHQAKRQFVWAAASPLFAAAAGLALLWWGLPRFGVTVAAWAGVLRAGVSMVVLLPGVGRYHRPRWRTPVTREAWRRIRPLLSRSVYFKADIVVDRFLGALAPAGSLSLLTLARQLYTAGLQVTNRALTAPMVPALAHMAERRAWAEFRHARNGQAVRAVAVAAALTVLLVVAGRPVLSLLFAHSSFRPEQVRQTWELLLVLSGVWVAGTVCQVLAGALYAQGDTETPTRIGVVSFTAGIALKVLGFFTLGIWGIAAGASLHYLLMLVLLIRAGRRPATITAPGAPFPKR